MRSADVLFQSTINSMRHCVHIKQRVPIQHFDAACSIIINIAKSYAISVVVVVVVGGGGGGREGYAVPV